MDTHRWLLPAAAERHRVGQGAGQAMTWPERWAASCKGSRRGMVPAIAGTGNGAGRSPGAKSGAWQGPAGPCRDAKASFHAARRSPDGCGRADRPCLSRGGGPVLRRLVAAGLVGGGFVCGAGGLNVYGRCRRMCRNPMLAVLREPEQGVQRGLGAGSGGRPGMWFCGAGRLASAAFGAGWPGMVPAIAGTAWCRLGMVPPRHGAAFGRHGSLAARCTAAGFGGGNGAAPLGGTVYRRAIARRQKRGGG